MVRLRVHPRDGRLRMIEPTPPGRTEVAEVAEQNRRADALAAGLLDGLTTAQRDRLTEAMGTTRRLLRLAAITVTKVDGAHPDGPRRHEIRQARGPPRGDRAGRSPERVAATSTFATGPGPVGYVGCVG